MRNGQQQRRRFRPSLEGSTLEERVVLDGSLGMTRRAVAAAVMPVMRARQTTVSSTLTRRELLRAYRTQLQAATNELRQYIRNQLAQLYANGRPTADQLATFRDQIGGGVNATAFRLSSQLALLPRATERLIARVQDNLIASNPNGLLGRFNQLLNSGLTQSPNRLANALDRAVTGANSRDLGQLTQFLGTSPIYRNAIDPITGQTIPLQQYMAQQAIFQFGNTLGSLANSFPTVANSALFQNGVISTDPAIQGAFATQLTNAVSLAANQLANNLAVFPNNASLFPGSGTNVLSPISQALFGGGTAGGGTGGGTGGVTSNLFSALGQIPTTGTSSEFFQGVNTAFTNAFQNVNGVLNPFFGTTALPGASQALPTGPFWNPFQASFSNLGNGFNAGFGSGFIGFGGPGSNVPASFGLGFHAMLEGQNTGFGFTNPGFTGFGLTTTGTGTGTGLGTGSGTTTLIGG